MRRQAGFAYLTALYLVALLGGGLALTGEVWHSWAMREKEAELLFAGNQYRMAIAGFRSAKGGIYPRSLEELVEARFLRRRYPDPVTGGEWVMIRAPDGGIAGLHSSSAANPFKTSGFKPRDLGFEGAQRYSDWKFLAAAAR